MMKAIKFIRDGMRIQIKTVNSLLEEQEEARDQSGKGREMMKRNKEREREKREPGLVCKSSPEFA